MKKNIMLIFILLFCLSVSALKQIKVGYIDNPPKIYQDELSGEVEGFWADITNEIGKEADLDITWVFGAWNECLERLESGEIDVVVDIAESEFRKEKFLFTKESVLLSWSTVYTNINTEVNSLLDFQNKTIGVMAGSVNYKDKAGIVDLLTSFEITPEFVEFDSYSQVLDAVAAGQIFGGVASKDIGSLYMIEGRINATPFWFQPNHLKYATSLKNPQAQEIINVLNKYVYDYKHDSKSIYYQAIENHLEKHRTNAFPSWAKLLLVTLLAIIIVFYLFNRILSAKVKEQTQNLIEEIKMKEKAQQSLLIANKKLKGMNQIKDNFLRSVSHELLTPLNVILGYSDILFKSKEILDCKLQSEYLGKIHSSGTNLSKIVLNMIDATLINSNLITLREDKINIYDFTQKLFKDFPKNDELNYSLKILGDYDKSLTMITDSEKLNKILIHLLENAKKFTEKGEVCLSYKIEGEYIYYSVTDSGKGISKQDRNIIFQGFTKLQNSNDRLYEGAGLGLAIVYALVTSLQGEVSVESTLSKGSTFLVKLPLKIDISKHNE